jgi:thiosulfate dehydrogenase
MWFAGIGFVFLFPSALSENPVTQLITDSSEFWVPPSITSIPDDDQGKLIRYGRELIVRTGEYLGPNGTVSNTSNGMNCENCHLKAGTTHFGGNFSAVASTYPKFRPRYGGIESIERRVNDCFMRSLNGDSLRSSSHEMRAIVAYIRWVGHQVEKGEAPIGSGLMTLSFLDRAASPGNGKVIYAEKCAVCHGVNGEGMINSNDSSWLNPPLWGDNSYNVGAGLYRLSRFAGFVRANMPWGTTYNAPQLSDEEAWDVAAYINSNPRPGMDLSKDWPDLSTKPIDYPFGPFLDTFNEQQHKLGPFKPIEETRAKKEFSLHL